MRFSICALGSLLVLASTSCPEGPAEDAGIDDAGAGSDAMRLDTTPAETATPDRTHPDAWQRDAAVPDTAQLDTARADAGPADAAPADAAPADAAPADAAQPDGAQPDSTAPDTQVPDSANRDSAVADQAPADRPLAGDAGSDDGWSDAAAGDDAADAGDGGPPEGGSATPSFGVSDLSGTAATWHLGQLPPGDSMSTTHIEPFAGNSSYIRGGTNFYEGGLVGEPVAALLIGFDELPESHFELPVSGTQFGFYVTLGQSVTATSLTLVVVPVLVGATPVYGQPLRLVCSVLNVGIGLLQVSVSWNTQSDVDLHLVEPGGSEIYWNNRTSASGGTLDLDSNSGCTMDYVNNENITYQNGTPLTGHYIVRVDYWDACGISGLTDFAVTVTARDSTQVYLGSFVAGDADRGEAGAGRTVAEFDF